MTSDSYTTVEVWAPLGPDHARRSSHSPGCITDTV